MVLRWFGCGINRSGEDIDAIDFAPNGNLVISTTGTYSVSGVSGGDEDLLAFSATSLGANTSGTWSQYFDGSDVGLANSSNEDVNGLWIDEYDGKIYLSTLGAFSVPGVSGDGADIFICAPGSLGSNTSCTYDSILYWDGSLNGFAGQVVDGIDIMLSAAGATSTPVPLPIFTSTSINMPTNTSTSTSTRTPTNTAVFTLTTTNTPVIPTATNASTSMPANTLTFTPANTPTRTPTNTPISTASVITIGETAILSADDLGNGNLLMAQQVVLSQSATIQSLSFYVSSVSGQLRLGIYDDAGGKPGTLRAQTIAFTPVVGWNTQNVQAPVLLAVGTYWLVYLPQSNNLHFRIALTGSAQEYSYSFGTMPNTYLMPTWSDSVHWSFYATLTR